MTQTFRMLSVAGLLVVGGAGCSRPTGGVGPAQPPQEVALHEVADLIRAATSPAGKCPTKLADFDRLQSMYANGYQAVKSGEVIVLWGAGVKGEGDAAKGGGDVIAYEKGAPDGGGYVLLNSSEVRKLTPAEFAAAPKAGGKK